MRREADDGHATTITSSRQDQNGQGEETCSAAFDTPREGAFRGRPLAHDRQDHRTSRRRAAPDGLDCAQRGDDMVPRRPKANSKKKVTTQKPMEFDFKKGQEMVDQMVRDNIEWLKEMAKK